MSRPVGSINRPKIAAPKEWLPPKRKSRKKPNLNADPEDIRPHTHRMTSRESQFVKWVLPILRENEFTVSILALMRHGGIDPVLNSSDGTLEFFRDVPDEWVPTIRNNKPVILNALKAEARARSQAKAFGAPEDSLMPYEHSKEAGTIRKAYEFAAKAHDDGTGDKALCLALIKLVDDWLEGMGLGYLTLPRAMAEFVKVQPEFAGILQRIIETRELAGKDLRVAVQGELGKKVVG